MKIIQVSSYEEVSEKAADLIAEQILAKPDCTLGLATGSTPIRTYENLIEFYHRGKIDFSRVSSINLDEYVGLDGTQEQSYRFFMDRYLFNQINIKKDRTFVPDGKAIDLEEECRKYDERIKELGGIDLQLLGIGNNGHIGFNEPDHAFIGKTHVVELGESTIRANARFFSSEAEVPGEAITMGMRGIMQAGKVVLIAAGKEKAKIIQKAVEGPITPSVPASILQLHKDCTVIYSAS